MLVSSKAIAIKSKYFQMCVSTRARATVKDRLGMMAVHTHVNVLTPTMDCTSAQRSKLIYGKCCKILNTKKERTH